MAHGSDKGNHSERRSYKYGDQKHYNAAQIRAAAETGRVNAPAYMNRDQAVNRIRDEEYQRRLNERLKHESGYAVRRLSYRSSTKAELMISLKALMHGNKPSRGATMDAEIQLEEAKMLRKMDHKEMDTKENLVRDSKSKDKNEWRLDLNVQPKADVIGLSKGDNSGRW